MKTLSLVVIGITIATLISIMAACRPNVDADLRQYLQMNDQKTAEQFLRKPVSEQIDIYLRIAALSFEPPDYSAGKIIATRDGDISKLLSERLIREHERTNLESLLRLAGQYCSLNASCRSEFNLKDAVNTAVERIPNWRQDSFVAQNVKWVWDGVTASSGERK